MIAATLAIVHSVPGWMAVAVSCVALVAIGRRVTK